jgi:hypothetical protein
MINAWIMAWLALKVRRYLTLHMEPTSRCKVWRHTILLRGTTSLLIVGVRGIPTPHLEETLLMVDKAMSCLDALFR